MRTGGVEPPQREAAGLQPAELTDARRPLATGSQRRSRPLPRRPGLCGAPPFGTSGVTDRIRTGTAGFTTPGARRLHHGHHDDDPALPADRSLGAVRRGAWLRPAPLGDARLSRGRANGSRHARVAGGLLFVNDGDDRTRTGGLSPDKRVLCASELRPRCMARVGFEPTSRAHEAREDSRSSTALCEPIWPAGVEPAISGARSRRGGQAPPRPDVKPPAGLEPAASGLRTRRHLRFDHGGLRA